MHRYNFRETHLYLCPNCGHECTYKMPELMAQGMSSGQAIALVAEELRANHSGERIVARFEDEDE